MFREPSIGESALLTDLALCVNYYRLSSPGLYCCVHATVQLADGTRLRPGLLAMVNHGRFKQCAPEPDGDYFLGPPNFVLDVFPGDGWHDYELRRDAWERAGALEYVAVRDVDPLAWFWNQRVEGKFQELTADDDQVLRSAALPGLWIPTLALRRRDWWAVMAAVARGVTRVEHHEFMRTIWKAGDSTGSGEGRERST